MNMQNDSCACGALKAEIQELHRQIATGLDEILSLRRQVEASVEETREAREAVRAQAALLARTLLP